jgi:hypothetical protein
MNKTNNSQATNSTCGSKNKTFINKNRIYHNPLKNSSTTGSYVTYVNLYLHPNSHNTTNATNDTNTNDTNTSKNLKASKKPMCNNKECHYYDPLCDEYYYCCNPSCYCFDPFYFDLYPYDPYLF